MAMSENQTTFPPVRACIFDVDGLLINSEDIYTEIYNNILHSYGKPDLPWSIKAKQQSRGRQGMLQLLSWAQLPITHDEWTAKISAQYHLFKTCTPLPGVPKLLSTLSSHTAPAVHTAIASSATSTTFAIKTSHLPDITAAFPPECRVFGDDAAMSEARKKPMPDVFLLALGRINARLGVGEREVRREECLVFEDSVAGVEAGRRAGMRICWVPHQGLREVWTGREGKVLEGKSEVEEEGNERDTGVMLDEELKNELSKGRSHLWSEDGWAEMLISLEEFDYAHYGIRLKGH
ncbi:Pseudouridine-5'-phosphatase [Imshaugia aleurites]|uniref:Pseudouridine-5'-phosphatase n=1 Tax=Imshaugia aleurites TaxID=172621 RepID=A0A8H3IB25_9LECA|nr:Pseudouridine-5'-phosphatase [Imshaugia aleurites]